MSEDKLPLRDLEVAGYRGIRHLKLPELGRVNLFVGRNNAGKSSLLEAIRLRLEDKPGAIAALVYEVLLEHTDFHPRLRSLSKEASLGAEDIEAAVAAMESLFFGGFNAAPADPIRVWADGRGPIALYGPRMHAVEGLDLFSGAREEVFFDSDSRLLTIVTPSETRDIPLRLFIGSVPVRFRGRGDTLRIPSGGLRPREVRGLWDRIAVSGGAELVEDAMRSIWPSFERALSAGDNGRRSVFIKLRDASRPVPLQSLGDGVQRVFAITVALALASGGAFVVDEVENGLHHTAQLEVWDSIFVLAERMDVQVFATTHSWEAVVAFQDAANRSLATGLLYRLEREESGHIYAEKYTEEDVAVAAEQQVEVR